MPSIMPEAEKSPTESVPATLQHGTAGQCQTFLEVIPGAGIDCQPVSEIHQRVGAQHQLALQRGRTADQQLAGFHQILRHDRAEIIAGAAEQAEL